MDGWQRAFVLHSRPWSETSLMLDVFTEESGRVRLVAKGARSKRSNLKGALQPFTPLLVRFGGRGEVKTLRSAEAVSAGAAAQRHHPLQRSHVNELISRVLEHETRFSELFSTICKTAFRSSPGPAARRSPRCGGVLSWRAPGTWAMAWIFSLRRERQPVDDHHDLPLS